MTDMLTTALGLTPFDVETTPFPRELAGRRFRCEGGMDALFEVAPGESLASVSAYSPGIVGVLARAYREITTGEVAGSVPWGEGGHLRLEWWIE